jgi:hypothetical protein
VVLPIVVVIFSLLGFMYKIGAYKKMEIKESYFQGGYFVYFNWTGNIQTVGKAFEKIDKDIERYYESKGMEV